MKRIVSLAGHSRLCRVLAIQNEEISLIIRKTTESDRNVERGTL